MKPLVTVVLPVYNGEDFLAAAIESILAQTFKDFIFFIANDASTDGSDAIIKEYAMRDTRIQHFTNAINLGLIGTLNTYCSKVDTEYLARMDQDDIAHPTRLEKQIAFLEQNPNIGIVGTCVEPVDTKLNRISDDGTFASSHTFILWKMLYTSGFSHPTVVMRKSVFVANNGYSPSALHVDDYDFFLRAKDITQFANLTEVLLQYRINEKSISGSNRVAQEANHNLLFKKYLTSFIPEKESELLLPFLRRHRIKNTNDYWRLNALLTILYKHFIVYYPPTKKEKKLIEKDLLRFRSVLAITYKSQSFWRGVFMYFCIALSHPYILCITIKNKLNAYK